MFVFPTWMFFICIYTWVVCAPSSNENLVKVIVLFRHGKRAPLNAYFFNGKHEDEYRWPEGYGNLVREGKQQLYTLGHALRQRYENILVPYDKNIGDDVRAVTTSTERCYQSAAYVLAAFYSPSSEQKWSNELDWQPVPILFSSSDKIKIVGNAALCRQYTKELDFVKSLANETDINVPYLIKFLSSHVTSAKVETITDLFFVADYFNTKASFTSKIPTWISKEDYNKLMKFHVKSFNYLSHTSKMRRLLTGPLITDLIVRINETVYKLPQNSKFFFYSGHDSSLHSLARTLGIDLESVPNYGASMIIELYKFSSNDFRLKLLYSNDYSLSRLRKLIIPGCEELCPIRKFMSLIEEFVINDSDWQRECNLS